ncbi:3-isopropylmalate/(R)-2-methylmalate dehydratase large subunit/methanogen homoaconitase large subunit [Thermosporothrix hazakensis]|jgi:3-isopropylmalate/(R)-2-methylmalate dehydratase large subunit/methanogen homoaconitase large subunit|uniref:3-isopropylmalate dehydratase large subunit n=2 Tax=Thermosporothrix TaxID=768650 RepID=A0A326U277_THEHA|nr:3-isopropylmalate dehydratase large subunit [Thermosporothrix hazakensis]PZW25379.1 3-isopropylmalate/(R)-2-methylmalate dehydratase large subunit/methanogen homoaconitase large subunit [Thermosporothrix hazakensis]BBH90712.1 3-isopropylmalate dehydratase [Thermosporothrix sp. COM3]GCE48763.1 3-isopropylmalate dehydratase [Thermosporothrix hazakensis]
MGTLAEEIFSYKLGRPVTQGETVVVEVDHVMSHDTTSPLAIQAFRKLTENGRVFNAQRAHIVFDHIIPAATVAAATLQRDVRSFAREQQIEVLQEGICHQVMPEKGFVTPGSVIVGADSHTCTYGALGAFATGMGSTDIGVAYATGRTWFRVPSTINIHLTGELPFGVYAKDVTLEMVRRVGVDGANYRAVEYTGDLVRRFSISERFTFCNMAIEMGGKAGLVAPDEKTVEWLRGRTDKEYPMLAPHNPQYERVVEIDASTLSPLIACPPDVNNVVPVQEVEHIKIDQVFLGTCTNGRLDDLAIAASILRGKRIHPDIRMVVIPASREIYLEAMRLGYLETFVQAGASVGTPGCGPCIGRHYGVLGPGERALTTMNRNFTGRMGDPTAEIYLGSPATVAATALTGHITDPREFLAGAVRERNEQE